MVLPSAQEGLGAEPSLLWQVQGFLTWEISALRGSEAASVGMMWGRAHPHGKTEGNAVLRLAAFGGQLVPLFPAAARSQLGASHGGNLRKRGRTFRNWKVPQAKLHPSAVIPSHCGKREQPQLPAALILPSCCILSLLNLLLVRCMDVTWKSLWWCLRGGEALQLPVWTWHCEVLRCSSCHMWGFLWAFRVRIQQGKHWTVGFGKCVVRRAVLLLFAMHRFAFYVVGQCGARRCSGGPARSGCVWQQLKSDWINCIVKL